MGAVANAVVLMKSDELRDFCVAVNAYVATTVLTEAATVPNHVERVALAKKVLGNARYNIESVILAVATHPPLALKGVTVGDGKAITEQDLIDRLTIVWTVLSKLDAGVL